MYSVCRLYWIYGYTARHADREKTDRRQTIVLLQTFYFVYFCVSVLVSVCRACVCICILEMPEVLLGFLVLPVAVSPACLVSSRQRCYVHR